MLTRAPRLLGVAWLVASACAHAPAAPPPPPVAWPAAPARPLVRLITVVAPGAAPGRSGLARLVDLVTGAEAQPAPGDRLARPAGLATADGRAFAVADPAAPGVFLVADGAPLRRRECPASPWAGPMAATYQADGALLVADAARGRILRLAGERCEPVLDGLGRPVGVAASGGRVYAVDAARHEVVAAAGGGVPLRFGADVLASPVAIAAAPDGSLLVADALEARLVRFGPDGQVLGFVGGRGPEEGDLLRPKAVAVDPSGRIFVLEASQDRIAVFTAGGRLLAHLGEPGAGPGRFTQATGLVVTASTLAVIEADGRIQVFELVGGTS